RRVPAARGVVAPEPVAPRPGRAPAPFLVNTPPVVIGPTWSATPGRPKRGAVAAAPDTVFAELASLVADRGPPQLPSAGPVRRGMARCERGPGGADDLAALLAGRPRPEAAGEPLESPPPAEREPGADLLFSDLAWLVGADEERR